VNALYSHFWLALLNAQKGKQKVSDHGYRN